MITTIKRALSVLAMLMLFVIAVPTPANAAFNPIEGACQQGGAPNAPACQRQDTTEDPIVRTIKRVTTIVATVAGIVAVLMIIFFGFQFVSSAGDPQKAKSARMGIIYSAVGLAVIALSVPLINLILSLIG